MDEDAAYALMIRLLDLLSPLMEHLGPEAVDAILTPIAEIAHYDRQTALVILERYPAVIEALLPQGEQTILAVLGLANECIPYGVALAAHFLEAAPRILAESDFETLTKTAALACNVAQINNRTAETLIAESPAILTRLGFEGLRTVALYATQCARSSWTYSIKAVGESAGHIDRLMAAGADRSLVLTIYSLGARITQNDWNLAMAVIEKSPLIVNNLAASGGLDLASHLFERAGSIVPFDAKLIDAFLDTTPALIELLGASGAEPIWQCAFSAAADKPENAVSLLKRSPAIREELLSHLDARRVGAIYDLGRGLCRFGSSLALKFITASGELAKRLDEENMATLADMAGEMAKASLTAAGAFLEMAPALSERTDMAGLGEIAELGITIAKISWETATRIILKSPDLIDRIGIDGVKMIGDFSIPLARESASEAIRLLDKCPQIIDGLLTIGDFSLVAQVCRLGKGVVTYNARLAASLLARSPEIIHLIGLPGLEKIAELTHEMGKESWTAAVSLLETSPRILELAGFAGLAHVAEITRRLARENSFSAVSLIEKSPDLMNRLRPLGDETLILRIYNIAQTLASTDGQLAKAFLDASPELLAGMGFEGVEKLIHLISDPPMNSRIAARLLDTAATVTDKIGFSGLEILSELATVIAETDQTDAAGILEKSPSVIERLNDLDDRSFVATGVYDLTLKLARVSPSVAVKLLEKSPDLINGFGYEGFCMIAALIESQAKEDEEKALSFLAAEETVLTDFMENIPKGLELKTVQPILSKYLQALLGRRVEIAEADQAYTDGLKIYLPKRIKDFQDKADNFTLYKVAATHQEAHLEYGSFEFAIDKIPECVERTVSRYEIESTDAASPTQQFLQLFPEQELARDLFNMMEDYRIENILKREYPVLGGDILRMNRHRFSKRRSPRKITNPKQRVVEMIAQSLMADNTFDAAADEATHILQKSQAAAVELARPAADVHDAACCAADLYGLIDAAFKDPYQPVKSIARHLDQETVSRNMGNFGKTARHIGERIGGRPSSQGARPPSVDAPGGSGGETTPTNSRPGMESIQQQSHRAGQNQVSFQSPARGGKQESGAPDPEAWEAATVGGPMKYDSPEKIERLLKAVHRETGMTPREIQERFDALRPNEIYHFLHSLEASLDRKTELQTERGASLYPEWGDDLTAYRNNWAKVREQMQPGASLTFYRETAEKHTGLLKKIRREFQMLKPEGFTKLKRQYDGDDIDLDAVVEYLTDRKVGLSPSEKNYRLTRKKKRDIACAFLIDMSRSTRGATIKREKEALIIMSEALHEVGDAFAVFGFSGDNRDNVDYYRIKDFDDPYDDRVKKRMSAIADHFENRDGTAIRHTTQKLKKRPERTKLMILLSDGKPVDKEYSGVYAIEDTRMALKEARHDGVKTFCITVDQNAAEYLPRMYSHSSWTVIDDVVKLPEKITRIYRMLTS